jgi:hypothetical protein
MPFPDLKALATQTPTVAPQQLTAAQTVHGVGVKTTDRESNVIEVTLGTLAGAPTGGTVTAIMEESPDNSTWSQVNGSDSVVMNYNDTLPEVLRYRYLGGTSGKQAYIRCSITAALTGGSSPTVIVAANVLQGGLRYAGQQPTPGSAPQTPGTPLNN